MGWGLFLNHKIIGRNISINTKNSKSTFKKRNFLRLLLCCSILMIGFTMRAHFVSHVGRDLSSLRAYLR